MAQEKWIRTCQECGHKQEDINPNAIRNNRVMDSFQERKCKKCKSIGLDYGSWEDYSNEDWGPEE